MKLSEQEKKEIIVLYLDNCPIKDIIYKYDISRRTVHAIIKNNKINKRTKQLNSKHYDSIINLFVNGESGANIAKKYDINIKTVYNILKRKNIYERHGTRKFFFDEEYFKIFSPESCYWAGFIASDGSVFNNTISIGINDRDIEHLVKFLSSIKGKQNIRKCKKNIVRLDICSKKMKDDLEKNFYIVPNKTKILTMPDFNECFARNYIRGFFDGDGTIYMNFKRMQMVFSIVSGSHTILDKISEYIFHYVGVKCNIYGERKFTLAKSGSKVLDIMNWLYNNSNIYLDRKYNKYNILLSVRKEYDKILLEGFKGQKAKIKVLYNRGFDKIFVEKIFNNETV